MKRIAFVILALFIFTAGFAKRVYVSNSGNDSYSGLSRSQAVLTLAKAETLLAAGDILLLERGDIWYETFTVSVDNFIISPYGSGANPIISGFQTITDWTSIDAGDTIYYKVLSPESMPNVLTINGIQYGYGRTPNTGTYYNYESYSTNVSITDNQLTASPDWDGAEVVIYKNEFKIDRCIISDHTDQTIAYTRLTGGGTNYNGTAGEKYFIQNDIRTLDQFGEWYYKSTNDTLFVYFGATDPATLTTKVSVRDHCIENTTYDNITIRNISFEGSNSSCIYSSSSSSNYVVVENCRFNFSGGDGVTLNGDYAQVKNCTFANIAGNNKNAVYYRGGAVYTEGDSVTISGNIFKNIAMIDGIATNSLYMIPVTIGDNYFTVKNNTIDTSAYMGIYATNEAITGTIRKNLLNATCQILPDAGSIYMGHEHTGTVIDSNIVVNSGGNGIYLDEYCNGVTVFANTVFNANGDGIKLHKAWADTISANTLWKNNTALNFTNYSSDDTIQYISVTNNIFASDSGQYAAYFVDYNSVGHTFGTASGNYYIYPGYNKWAFVLYTSAGGIDHYNFDGWVSEVGTDGASTAVPKDIYNNNTLFYFNASPDSVTYSFSGTYKDATGNSYTDSKTLQAYQSIILFDTISYTNLNIDAGLFAGYKLEEASGAVQDVLTTHPGTSSGIAYQATGVNNYGVNFDTSTDYIYFPYSSAYPANEGRTFCFWVKLTSMPSTAGRTFSFTMDYLSSYVQKYYLEMTSGDVLRFIIRNTSNSATITTANANVISSAGEWYHIAVITPEVGEYAKIYVNGSYASADTKTTFPGPARTDDFRYYLGLSANAVYGIIDDFYVWDRQLSPMEIYKIYSEGIEYPFE